MSTKKCMREKSDCPETSPARKPKVLRAQIQGSILRIMKAGPNGNKKCEATVKSVIDKYNSLRWRNSRLLYLIDLSQEIPLMRSGNMINGKKIGSS